ncbi:MAG: C1 family peptidase [Pyrinomonadaceae bacterium]|nr:C1 family peptidase [Pyrinomonadaceae bacterium]
MMVGTCLLVTTMSAQIKRDEGLSVSERRAPPTVQSSLLKTRELIRNKNLGFRVGVTGVAGREMKTLAGTITPPNLSRLAAEQNKEAAKVFNISPDKLLTVDVNSLPILQGTVQQIMVDPFGKVTTKTVEKKSVEKKPPAGVNEKSASFDWRAYGLVLPIRSQKCGSCWAFAAQGLYELGYMRSLGYSAFNTSEQFLISNGKAGDCSGGHFNPAIRFLHSFGAMGEDTYPDTGTNGTPVSDLAALKPLHKPVLTFGWPDPGTDIPSVEKMKKALVLYGPVAVSMTSTESFKLYTEGVFDENSNDPTNHAVIIMGWDDSKQAWIVRNSWGTDWGTTAGFGSERGYAYVKYFSNSIGSRAMWLVVK